MTNLILAAAAFGGYIAIYKLIIFLILFFGWLAMLDWLNQDAKTLGLNDIYWAGIIGGAGAAGAIIFLLVPLFIVSVLLYLTAIIAPAVAYLKHRDSQVPEFDRILTAEFIQGLFAGKGKTGAAQLEQFVFITANNNEVPVPEPKTPEFFGYKKAYDLFNDAIWRRASDVICNPGSENYSIVYYVDGAALKQPSVPNSQMEHFIHFVKLLANLDVQEKRKPQEGGFRIFKDEQSIDWKVSTAGSTAGEQIIITHKTKQTISRLTELGLEEDQLKKLSSINQVEQGLFIVAGPEKSGISSTFYALLKNHDAFLNNICTLEKEPSLDLPNIVQNIFSLSDTGTTTYAKKLQTIVRMGADIVGVADCDNHETARIACEAAKDGKLIYITLKADSVMKALSKWIKLVGDKDLAVETLIGITNQRLIRKLCEDCKQGYEPNKELLKKFNLSPEKAKVLYRPGKVRYTKRGKPFPCESCQETGFVGRMSIFEIIIIDEQLRKIAKQSKSLSEIDTEFRRAKMLGLKELALKKVIEGLTSVNEMVRIFSDSQKHRSKKAN